MAISPPANHYDLSFLAPCPASGLILSGDQDKVAPPADIERSLTKVRVQKGEVITRDVVEGANHFYQGKLDAMTEKCAEYLDTSLRKAESERLGDI